ncbi:MAG: Gfo/Idh/MocA family oxidoreductase [Candidatus Hydrogenedentes bacterium]|nr:Gfo/Idh/MocA family oxidoreductase [Candidatus Hydrogenedentota bacterium]
MNRRTFLKTSAAAGAVSINALGANDRLNVGIMGIHDRGMDLAQEIARRDDVTVRYLADPDSTLFEERAKTVGDLGGTRPECIQDFRRMLDDPDIDAIAIATPDHWHALATVLACQAGKDVYVEKPTSQSIWESRKMVEAARKYARVVQVGTQNRSAEYCWKAIEYAQSGALGDIHFIRIMNSKLRESIGHAEDAAAPPEGVDYDMWLGPAPARPFNPNHFHYNWHWFWDYGGGDMANDGVHQIDLARWISGRTLPNSVSAGGGIHVLKDDRETPDTHTVALDFDGLTMAIEQTLWTPYMKKTPFELRDTDQLPNWPFSGTRIDVYGTKNFMFFGRMGGGWQVFDGDGHSVAIQPGKFSPANTQHVANFVECIRSRQRPNADIEEGHYSTLLAHYSNIALRTSRRLEIDPATEGFINDNDANALVKRTYRQPWVVPEAV